MSKTSNLWAAWLFAAILIVWFAPADFGGQLRYDAVKEARRIDAALSRRVKTAAWTVGDFLGWTRGDSRPFAEQSPDAPEDKTTTPSRLPREARAQARTNHVSEGLGPPVPSKEDTGSLMRDGAADVEALDGGAMLVSRFESPEVSHATEPVDTSIDALAVEPAPDGPSESIVE